MAVKSEGGNLLLADKNLINVPVESYDESKDRTIVTDDADAVR